MAAIDALFDVPELSQEVPHRSNPNPPIVIHVSARIGAGKTTLVQWLARKLAEEYRLSRAQDPSAAQHGYVVEYALEKVEMWSEVGIFQEYCRDIKRWAIEFQQFVMVTRIKEELAMYRRNPNADVYLIERSVFDDYLIFIRTLYLNGQVSDMQLMAYKQWWSMWVKLLPYRPSGFVWLQVTTDELMLRVQKRARECETDSVPREYQEQLEEAHQSMFSRIEQSPAQMGLQESVRVLRLSVQHDYRQCPVLEKELRDTFVRWVDELAGRAPMVGSDHEVDSTCGSPAPTDAFDLSSLSVLPRVSEEPRMLDPAAQLLVSMPNLTPNDFVFEVSGHSMRRRIEDTF